MKDIIVLQGRYFRLFHEESTTFDKSSIKTILPEDVVDYTVEETRTKVTRIISRRTRVTYGVLYGRSLSLPLLSPHFLTYVPNHPYAIRPTSCLVKVETSRISIMKSYGRVDQRDWDLQICQDIFVHSALPPTQPPMMVPGKSLYDSEQRVDQRGLFTFTIDPVHSRDFDDAISVDIEEGKIYVHIVDIHHQLIDEPEVEARGRSLGNTLYLTEGVYNVFPDFYANHVLSLAEGEDRLVITVEMQLGEDRTVVAHKIYPALIRVNKRYCYEEADSLPLTMFLQRVVQEGSWMKFQMHNFRFPPPQQSSRTPSHEIIEALMVKANQIVSQRLQTSDYHKVLQRYHESTPGMDLTTLQHTIPDPLLLLLRLRRARYSSSSSGHFALGLDSYTHFTSPIRRSFDVLVHKVLAGIRFEEEWLEKTIDYLNDREMLIDKICQLYQQLKWMSYLEERVDVLQDAEVIKVLPRGIQIFIPELLMSGFVTLDENPIFQTKDLIRVYPQTLDWKTLSIGWSIGD
jgi:ribonuclease R